MTTQPQYRRKLIEVDLPLKDINRESAREKSIRHGHPSTLHLWWARTIPCPNPACGMNMPLMRTFQLSKKRGNAHWTRPIVDREAKTISWIVQDNPNGVPLTSTVNRNGKWLQLHKVAKFPQCYYWRFCTPCDFDGLGFCRR